MFFSISCLVRIHTALTRVNYPRRRAQIAGLELREINALEREFLSLLDFRLSVSRDEYDACAASLAAMRIPDATPPGRPKTTTHTVDDGAGPATRTAPARPSQCAPAAAARERSQDTAAMTCGAESPGACGVRCGGGGSGYCREPGAARPPAGPIQHDDA